MLTVGDTVRAIRYGWGSPLMCSRGQVDRVRRRISDVVEDRNGAGGVAEWPKVRHWKCRVGATLPWVRIPPPPPFNPQHGEAMLTVGETVRAFVPAQSVVATSR